MPIVFTQIKGANKEKREQVIIIPRQTVKSQDDLLNHDLKKSVDNVISNLSEEERHIITAESKSKQNTPRDPCF